MMPILPEAKHNILIEFECLADLDYGCIKYVYENYDNEKVGDDELDELFNFQLAELSENLIKGLIHDNPEVNPVRILMDIENYDKADEIYDDIMSNHLTEILMLTPVTNLIMFCKKCVETDGLCDISILCTRNEYVEIMSKIFSEEIDQGHINIIYHNFIDEDDPDPFDAKKYTCLFLRYAQNLFRYTNLDGKTIYIQECLINMNISSYESGIGTFPNPRICGAHMECNRIFIFSPYSYNNSYFINFDYPFDNLYEPVMEPEEIDENTIPNEEKFMDEREMDSVMRLFNDLVNIEDMNIIETDEEIEDVDDDGYTFTPEEMKIIIENWEDNDG